MEDAFLRTKEVGIGKIHWRAATTINRMLLLGKEGCEEEILTMTR